MIVVDELRVLELMLGSRLKGGPVIALHISRGYRRVVPLRCWRTCCGKEQKGIKVRRVTSKLSMITEANIGRALYWSALASLER